MAARLPITNTQQRYGWVAILLHWLMAALVIGIAGLGLYMTSLPDVGFNMKKINMILVHKELGLAVLFLLVLRLAWRVTNLLPDLVEQMPDWQKVAARFVHLCFYALLVAVPVSGWLMSSAGGFPVSVFGLFTLPDLLPQDDSLFERWIDIHGWLAYVLIGLIVIHAWAALRHHVVLKDDSLRNMLP